MNDLLLVPLGVIKTLIILVVFLLGCISIVLTQLIGLLISKFLNHPQDFVQGWMSITKDHFITLLVGVITFASQNDIHIRITSPDISKEKVSFIKGRLHLSLAPHGLMFANHQIYTDWMFLWWLAQSASLGGFVYIMLKNELENIPLLGFGMSCYEFIFLTRKWDKDRGIMDTQLERIDANARGMGPANGFESPFPKGNDITKSWPYQLIIYPEGTNMSANTRSKTQIYAEKAGKKPFKHVLLPRITGLRYSLLKLQGTLDEVYDITVGYSGVKEDEYGQDIYKLSETFIKGKNPKLVDLHINVLKINEIPLGQLTYDDPEQEQRDIKEFEEWLYQRWSLKDELMDRYFSTGSFIDGNESLQVITTLKTSKMNFLKIFFWLMIVTMVIRGLIKLIRILY
jgi:1-acyl-sn-glycerol-3-phosphate acyltransferase